MSEPYKFRSGQGTVERGQHIYGSKVDNSVCECPVCFGSKGIGILACKNCKGTGKVENSRMIKVRDLKVGMTVLVYDEPYKVTHLDFDGEEYSISFDSGETTELKPSDNVEVK